MDGLKAFSKWYERSSVRSAPQRILDTINQKRFFSPKLAPVLTHAVCEELSEDKIRVIEVQLLFHYLRFTEYLETNLVNKVILSIMNDELPVKFGKKLKNEAYKIYCDEAYHALQSYDMINQVSEVSGETPFNLPLAFKPRLTKLKSNFAKHLDPFFDLFFVCVAENLVSQELREHVRDETIHPAIKNIMKDHARDEATHALFFKEVMVCLKQQLPKSDFLYFTEFIPLFSEAYLLPKESNLKIIFAPFLSEEKIKTILNDSISPEKMEIFITKSSSMLEKTLEEIKNTVCDGGK